ncbi:Uncharacterised protein [Yersinia frederiksenii]|jgi:hypothetical protein|uniref:Uncharacterized protein n=1 Tax=Yersinia frederiksenii TaxID=29484 RepID=A0AAI8ZSY8_YERFR|nr:Uncharacterised protein [Yersinia frederiksenii]CFR17065.1 Uncharacterised protein [Yersinia frederiksenii]
MGFWCEGEGGGILSVAVTSANLTTPHRHSVTDAQSRRHPATGATVDTVFLLHV